MLIYRGGDTAHDMFQLAMKLQHIFPTLPCLVVCPVSSLPALFDRSPGMFLPPFPLFGKRRMLSCVPVDAASALITRLKGCYALGCCLTRLTTSGKKENIISSAKTPWSDGIGRYPRLL